MLGIGKPWLSVFLLFWGYQTNDLSILFLSYMRRIVFARDHTIGRELIVLRPFMTVLSC